MTELRVKGILFDMDGVLVRSEGSVDRAWTAWARRHGFEIGDTIMAAHGRRSIDTVRALRPDLDAEVENAFVENLEITDTEGLAIMPGVHALIESLPIERWTIVTSASRKLAIARLTAGNVPLPPSFVTGDDVLHGKPDPAPYRMGAALLGFATGECLVIEDASSGVASGKAAGCKVLAVAAREHWDLLAAADYRIESLVEVEVRVGCDGLVVQF